MAPYLPPLGHATPPSAHVPCGPQALPTLTCTAGAASRPALFLLRRLVTGHQLPLVCFASLIK